MSLSHDKISAYNILSNNISNEDMNLLNESCLINREIKIMKISLIILKQGSIKESKLFDYKGFEYLLSNSSDPLKTLRYLLKEENKPKILTEFVCEIFNPNGCSEYGKKISESLIRVAATRIFSDPEQSVVELPVNSVDSYNSMIGKKTVGKFGMGFFSILYWLSESLNNNFSRTLNIFSTYKDKTTNELNSYNIKLNWTINGLVVNKEITENKIFDLSNSEWYTNPKVKDKVTGTTIYLDCSKQNLSDENVRKMSQQLYKLFPIEGTTIYLNGNPINKIYQNKVSIKLNKSFLVVEDNAVGIPEEILIKSLLVPSSSSKERITEVESFRDPEIVENQNNKYSELNIIVNGVCINNIISGEPDSSLNKNYNYNIYMPYNSKVPVSRDNIIYEHNSMEIENFQNSLKKIINMTVSLCGNLVTIFRLLEIYMKINTSDALSKAILNIKTMIENSGYILLPNLDFWIQLKNTSISSIKSKLIIYEHPNLYETEKKLEKLLGSSIRTDVFKLRRVIFGNFKENLSNNGLTTYLFISNSLASSKGLASLSMSNPTTLLIPISDTYDFKLYDKQEDYGLEIWLTKDIKNKITSNQKICKIAEIVKMTYLRKFSNINKKYVNVFIEKTINQAFVASNEDENFMLIFLTALNAKLSDIILDFTYGSTPLLISIGIPNKYNMTVTNVYKSINNSKFNELLLKITKRMLLFSVELISSKSSSYAVYLPNFEVFLFSLYDNLINLHNEILDECTVGINNCVTDSEIYIFMIIFFKFFESINKNNRNNRKNIKGISLFIVNEIRRKVSPDELIEILKLNFTNSNNSDHTEGKILKCLFQAVEHFYTYSNNKVDSKQIEIGNMYKFSCKSLINYVYNNSISDNTFQELTDSYSTFEPKNTKLQIVEIAVNEGTNKSFINSVLTEIIQNSVDAIRSNESSSKNIDINISNNIISVKDYVGFDNIINILIPFLSSKNPNDPNVTGEMGTGFFNVYRQPWTKFIVIEIVFNGKKKTIKATPLHNNNIVYDIEYKITIENTDESNYTNISIFLNKENNLLSQMITDAFIFVNSYLSFIRSAFIKLNGSLVKTNYSICYPENDPRIQNDQVKRIGDIMTINDPTTLSYVLTNDIPFMPLIDFVTSLNNPLITNMVKDYGRNSIIINLKKNVYTPTQARSKIQFVPDILQSVQSFVGFGIYCAILSLYDKNHYHNPDDIISFTSSTVDYKQLKFSDYNSSIIHTLKYPYLIYSDSKTGTFYKAECINKLINDAIDRRINYTDIDQSTIAGRVLYKWFSNKEDIILDKNNIRVKKLDVEFKILNKFSNIYWRMFRELIDERVITGSNPKVNAPVVVLSDLDQNVLGSYSSKSHKIFLNFNLYDEETLTRELIKIKSQDISSIATIFNVSETFNKYFSPCKPANTFIHEIGHAFTASSHSSSYHDTTSIKIKDSNFLGFEDMCTQIYQLCVEKGLINEFLASI
uniref:Histidine kinase/HSP90-like ATPase domain-containing protein n=1 Tax=viral metagenome TaxID=1070528 RepID=A0A6C0BF03_9ZZZZ